MAQHQDHNHYYIPGPSIWPIVGSIGLFVTALGAANWLHHMAMNHLGSG